MEKQKWLPARPSAQRAKSSQPEIQQNALGDPMVLFAPSESLILIKSRWGLDDETAMKLAEVSK